MLQLAALLSTGEGCEADPAQALGLLERASALGEAGAWTQLGRKYFLGDGVSHDERQALHCYQQAAELGDSAAQFNLGSMYANGQGTAQDFTLALRWYQAAAGQAPRALPEPSTAPDPEAQAADESADTADLRRAA